MDTLLAVIYILAATVGGALAAYLVAVILDL